MKVEGFLIQTEKKPLLQFVRNATMLVLSLLGKLTRCSLGRKDVCLGDHEITFFDNATALVVHVSF